MISSIVRHSTRSDEVMGRTTRVFGARVLRSGRRVWTGPVEQSVPQGKHPNQQLVRPVPVNGVDQLAEVVENKRNKNALQNGKAIKNEMMEIDVDEKDGNEGGRLGMEMQSKSMANVGKDRKVAVDVVEGGNRRWDKVYERKRKRETRRWIGTTDYSDNKDSKDSVVSSGSSHGVDVDRKFGRQFFRRKRRRVTLGDVFVPDNCEMKVHSVTHGQERRHMVLTLLVAPCASGGSIRSSYWMISCFLNSVLRYLRRAKLGLRHLYAFLCSEPIAHVYWGYGVRFLQGFGSFAGRGVCTILGARSYVPVFSVNFSALPLCFMHLHSSLLIRSARVLHFCVTNSLSGYDEREIADNDEHHLSIPLDREQSRSEVVASGNECNNAEVLHQTSGVPKLAGKTLQLKNGRGIQKRSSIRSKRGRPPSIFRMQKSNGGYGSDLLRSRHNCIQFSPLASNRQLRSSSQRNPSTNVGELNSLVDFMQDIGSVSCSANLLVIESDKCYRIEGAVVSLHLFESKQWYLTVKKDGIMRYNIRAEKVMRPCNTNRFTHAMIWIGDSNWKLEFPDRQDWFIFRKLYKECFTRNLNTPMPSFIPVPRVCEVEDYAIGKNVPFVRPEAYISMRDDELTRALVKETAIYDMDCEDQEWLNKFNNNGMSAESEHCMHLSAERFELMIDALEKAIHGNPDDFSVEAVAFSIFPERRVVEAVSSYWSEKRKKKRSALIRIFQCYLPKKAQVIPKSFFRKKRSFKRQGSQAGRGKQRTLLQAMAAEQDIMIQQNAILKVEEAKAAVNRSEGLAFRKRQRAQILMENADLATYKAAIALRIAEAAQILESAGAAAAATTSSFLS